MSEASTPEQNPLLEKIEFHPPIDSADPHYTYTVILDSAMEDKDVTNIALAGPYGSGKSSILKTYFENRRKGTYNPVWVSMAGFENADGALSEDNTPPKAESTTTDQGPNDIDVQRRIEQSILQQVFYSVEKKYLPLSKLRRIEKPDMNSAVEKSLWILVYLYVTIVSFELSWLPFAMPPKSLTGLFQVFFVLMTVVTLPWIIAHFSRARLNKIIIKDTEFSFVDDEQLNTSLINRHVDEIINYFEATGKDVMVVEDLDRFKMRSIFTKLRELNTLINQYAPFREKNKKVVFIYAVKDDLFAGEERTKFFDAIIPVIPQVNASGTALDFFKTRLGSDITGKLGVQFLTDISTYIHDFRLLANICNEFVVYIVEKEGNEQKIRKDKYEPILEDSAFVRKLFALIVYKNFFPEDFARLHQNRGWVYKVLNEKLKEAMDKQIEAIEKSIIELEADITAIEETEPLKLEEARLISIVEHLEDLGHQNIAAISNMTPAQMAKDEKRTINFLQMNGPTIEVRIPNGNNMRINSKPARQDLFDRINDTSARLNNKITVKQNDIADKVQLIRGMRRMTLVDIIKQFGEGDLFANTDELYVDSTDPVKKLNENEKTRRQPFEELVKNLLRQGYIANDYGDYISYFSGDGIMSHRDRDYRKRVSNNDVPFPDAIIDNPEAIYASVEPQFFSHPAAANHHMCMFLFIADEGLPGINEARDNFMDAIRLNQEFIVTFLESNPDIKLFIEYFTEDHQDAAWPLIANYEISDLRKRHIAYTLIANLNARQIKKLGKNFVQYLGAEIKLLSMYDERIESLAFKTLKDLNVRFSDMGEMSGERGRNLLEYIFKEDRYDITTPMISELTLLATEQPYKRKTWDVDYAKIVELGIKPLIVRIDKEIEKYVNDIYIPLMEKNGVPSENSVFMLLNHQQLSDETKEKLISKLDSAINSIARIENETQRMQTMKHHVALATWENMLTYYEDVHLIDEYAANYITNEEYFTPLISSVQHASDYFDDLIIDIVLHPDLPNEHLKMLAGTFKIRSISLHDVDEKRIKELIESGIIVLNPENYQTVMENAGVLHETLGATLILQDISTVLKDIHEYEITEDQAAMILDGLEDLDCSNVDSLQLAGALGRMAMDAIDKNKEYKFMQNQLLGMLTSYGNDRNTKLRLAVNQLPYHADEVVLTAIRGISSRYVEVARGGDLKRVSFPYSEIEMLLLEYLKERKIIGKNILIKGDEIIVQKLKNPAGKTVKL
jgi:hypothetical protein